MNCPHCGFENEEGLLTCSNCGGTLETQAAPVEEEPQRPSVWSWVAAALFVGLVAAALFIFKGPGLGMAQSEPLLYGVLGDQVIPFSQMGVLENGGRKATQLSANATSIAIAPYSIRTGHSYLSSTGQLALITDGGLTGAGQLTLADVKSGAANSAAEAPLPLTVAGNFQSFSPDGKYFGYTALAASGQSLMAVIVNSRAANVMVTENMILSEILPDSKHFLAYALDPASGNPAALVSVAIPSGEQSVLFQAGEADILAGADIVSPDGSVYFVMQRDGAVSIYRMALTGGDVKAVYTFKQPVTFFGIMSIMPDRKTLLVMDANDTATGYDLASVNPDDGAITTLATNVYAEFFGEAVFLRQMYGEMAISFSPDGKHMAYMGSDESGKLNLYVTDLSGQPGTLVASGQTAYSFAFTPESDRLVYIQYAMSGDMAGGLNVADFSGASTKLDGDVTSFNFQNNKLVYFGAPAAEQPTSTLYQSSLDGQGKTEVLPAQPGYWVFVKLPE